MSESVQSILMVAGVAAVCIITIKLLSKPIRFIFKLLINTAFGFVILFLVNFFGDPIGISLGVSWLNAFVAGVFGVPGVIFLIILKFIS